MQGDVIQTGEISYQLRLCTSKGAMHLADIFGRGIRGATTYDFVGADLVIHSPNHEFTFVPANT